MRLCRKVSEAWQLPSTDPAASWVGDSADIPVERTWCQPLILEANIQQRLLAPTLQYDGGLWANRLAMVAPRKDAA